MGWINKNWMFLSLTAVICVLLLWEKGMAGDRTVVQENDIAAEVQTEVLTDQEKTVEEDKYTANPEVMVDVKGEVQQPGVYEVKEDKRLYDIIELAGGFTGEADQTTINLAQRVYDEMVVIVAPKGEKLSDNAPAVSSLDASGKIRINTADKEALMQLSGIGAAKAEAIIAYREENGPFRQLEDLLLVSGVGEKVLAALKEEIQIP